MHKWLPREAPGEAHIAAHLKSPQSSMPPRRQTERHGFLTSFCVNSVGGRLENNNGVVGHDTASSANGTQDSSLAWDKTAAATAIRRRCRCPDQSFSSRAPFPFACFSAYCLPPPGSSCSVGPSFHTPLNPVAPHFHFPLVCLRLFISSSANNTTTAATNTRGNRVIKALCSAKPRCQTSSWTSFAQSRF